MTGMFEETATVPVGRKARTVSKELWAALEDSAKRGVAFARTADPDVIDLLRKDLASAAVKAKFDVTTSTAHLENGSHKLTFAAKAKPVTKPEAK